MNHTVYNFLRLALFTWHNALGINLDYCVHLFLFMAEQQGCTISTLFFSTDDLCSSLGKSKPFPLLRLRNIIMEKQSNFNSLPFMFGEA